MSDDAAAAVGPPVAEPAAHEVEPPAPEPPATPAEEEDADSERVWWYGDALGADDRKRHGPYTKEELLDFKTAGIVHGETFVWSAGMPNWLYLQDVFHDDLWYAIYCMRHSAIYACVWLRALLSLTALILRCVCGRLYL